MIVQLERTTVLLAPSVWAEEMSFVCTLGEHAQATCVGSVADT